MGKPTKEVSMTVRVKVPAGMSVSDARREVRTMLRDQCWHTLEDGELKLVSVGPKQKPVIYWGGCDWG